MIRRALPIIAILLQSSLTFARSHTPTVPPPTLGQEVARVVVEAGAQAIADKLSRPAIPPDAEIEVAFSPVPQGRALRLVQKAISSATATIHMAAYTFTSKPVADALIRAAARGVRVYVVLDAKANSPYDDKSKIAYLRDAGVNVCANSRYPVMHNKFAIIDGKHVETGSFNYSYAAEARNAENVIVVWNMPDLAAKYDQQFELLASQCD
ncbi:phospholipase D family nuclease [Methylovirgula sp. 4M-Z18]|uniref:phospholipase D family nuclease n=1 Tax=Methylovirgula sp. 4M-Z18 TaxID=2293567 RepID=UPI000E2E683C|nr:phospholipase D family protein [Methylovirgula sp. 4M-Z18]RFB76681.1 phospholipase D family protein [Methylovirgula sp. 4M-Z18]